MLPSWHILHSETNRFHKMKEAISRGISCKLFAFPEKCYIGQIDAVFTIISI